MPSLRSFNSNSGSNSNVIAMTKPTVFSNDIWLVRLSGAAPAGTIPTPPTGWNLVPAANGIGGNGGDQALTLLWRRIDGSEGASTSFSFNQTCFTQGHSYIYMNCITSGDVIGAASWQNGTSALVTALGITVPVDGCKLLYLASNYSSNYAGTAPTGFVAEVTAQNQQMCDRDADIGPTGDVTQSITFDNWSGSLVALLPAAAVAAPGGLNYYRSRNRSG
jgi:hypothetical protein